MSEGRVVRYRLGRVTARIDVSAAVVAGEVTEADLHRWVKEALAYYHTFRGGHVGISADAQIKRPSAALVEMEDA